MPRKIDFVIDNEYDNKKVLHYLKGKAKLSSRLITSLKHFEDGIQLNGEHTRTIDILHAGDILSVNLPDDSTAASPTQYDLDVVFEDDDILIVNKPAHLAIHPSHNHQGDTLANAVSWHLQSENKASVFRAVGRLDKNTSGLVVCALNKYSAARLNGKVTKEYFAIVEGVPKSEGTIDAPIYRPEPIISLRTVDDRGSHAVTHFKVVRSFENMSLVEIKLDTGRTHQIRVHFSYIGYPLLGDTMYGNKSTLIDRHALHCGKVSFVHPVTNKEMTFISPIPKDMENAMKGCSYEK